MTVSRIVFVRIMVPFFYRLTDKYCCQVGKDEGLDKRHQHFNNIYKSGESYRNRGKTNTGHRADAAENKDLRNQTNNNDVACQHIGEQTYYEGKGFGKDGKNLNRHHNKFDTKRHRRVYNVPPVMLVTAEVNHQERNNT